MIAAALMLAAVQPAACSPEHAAMGHCQPTPPAPAAPPPPVVVPPPVACPPEHAAMGHCTPTASAAPLSSAAPPAVSANAADAIWGADAMARSRHQLHHHHGGMRFAQVMLNIAEVQIRDGRDGYHWDGEAWFGGDRDRLVIKSEGGGALGGALDDAEVQALYSRAIGPYFNLQAGVRHDIRPRPSRTHLTLGVEGLAPYWFEVEAAAFLSDRGHLSGRVEAYYDQRLTQRLILQPRVEVNFAAQDDRAIGIGSGLSDLELGLRLRYEVTREFAPYVGIAWDRKLGDTARFARAAGEKVSDLNIVAGVRFWF